MKHYIIDGNNLIGKIKEIFLVQQKDKQASRVKLAYMIDNYFAGKNAKVTIHFDGFAREPIKLSKSKIVYSDDQSADDKIKDQIEKSKNRIKLTIVTSDSNLAQFSRVCSCEIIRSEDFAKNISVGKGKYEEDKIRKMENDIDEFKKLFGIDDKK
jgi:predicted RNA-binding protein with PIN domain